MSAGQRGSVHEERPPGPARLPLPGHRGSQEPGVRARGAPGQDALGDPGIPWVLVVSPWPGCPGAEAGTLPCPPPGLIHARGCQRPSPGGSERLRNSPACPLPGAARPRPAAGPRPLFWARLRRLQPRASPRIPAPRRSLQEGRRKQASPGPGQTLEAVSGWRAAAAGHSRPCADPGGGDCQRSPGTLGDYPRVVPEVPGAPSCSGHPMTPRLAQAQEP